jgi:crossover junction endodeoxyribonuclease RuvC
MQAQEKIILGIDPGTTIMGYGVLKQSGKEMEMLSMGVLHLSKIPEHPDKLLRIFSRVLSLIDEYKPDELAIEAPFFGKNVQSMLKLGRAQGVAMAAALYRSIPIFEYSPRKIKQSITGKGAASKEQVAAMLIHLLKLKDPPEYLDASDGLAAAVCHSMQNNIGVKSRGYTGWESFVSNNPGRVNKVKP